MVHDLNRPLCGAARSTIPRADEKNLGSRMGQMPPHWNRLFHRAVLAVGVAFCAFAAGETAQADHVGSASGLPIPRYVSLKSDRVNLREGPSKDHRTVWVFQRAGLPVEITAEFETWRKVRDSEGAEGWVLHSLLSGRRTALVTPWKKGIDSILYSKASSKSAPLAKLQPNVLASVRGCDGAWCRVSGEGFDGFIPQSNLWGVYPNEKIE
jgi:SH3-like domain-containing protein